jgi:hypothetical protein
MSKFNFAFDGPPGVGKSDELEFVAANVDQLEAFLQKTYFEKGEKKKEEFRPKLEFNDNEALSNFYDHRLNNAVVVKLFETSNLIGRLVRHMSAQLQGPYNIFGFDRLPLSGLLIFTENSFEDRTLSLRAKEKIYDIFKEGIEDLGIVNPFNWMEEVVVYQHFEAEELYERILARKTAGEGGLQLEYLKRICDKYEAHYADLPGAYGQFGLPSPHVIPVNAVDKNDNPDYQQDILDKLIAKMYELKVEER